MFGILKPPLGALNGPDRVAYSSTYCNLCGALSAEYGLSSRLLVVHDIATFAWLLAPESINSMPFKRGNCLRGGVGRVKENGLSILLKYLASISAFTLGVKLRDDERDQRNWRTATINALYHKIFLRSSQQLETIGADMTLLRETLVEQDALEARSEPNIYLAAVPTGRAYAAVLHEMGRFGADGAELSFEQRENLGAALGGAIYAIDAVRDYEKDLHNAYNPLCIQAGASNSMPVAVQREALKFIEECLAAVSRIIQTLSSSIQVRWNAVAAQLLSYLRPFPEHIILNARCYVPCEHGVVAFDDKECTPAIYGCLCCCCLGMTYCT